MVLTGSSVDSECSTSSARKIKIRQRVGQVAVSAAGSGGGRSTSPSSGSRRTIVSSRRPSAPLPVVTRMTESGGRTGVISSGVSATTTTRLPLHPKLRKILVEGQQENLDSPVASRSRNSAESALRGQATTTTAATTNITAAAAITTRRKSAAARARTKDVLSASPAANSRRARSPSPVLTRPRVDLFESDAIPKSASAPADLVTSDHTRGGILKRSSTFLAGLAFLTRRRSRRASSPRKSVSFSKDTTTSVTTATTGFASCRLDNKTAVHEAKLYRRGVLQDRHEDDEDDDDHHHDAANVRISVNEPNNLPAPWREPLGGPRALLGAAQDGDDEFARRILAQARKPGPRDCEIDVNAVDASGRTAVSYMAGNGSALVLETCLTFHGADANLPDNEGNTPLHFAAQAGQTECLNILLQRCQSIEVDARNSLGFTPLMKAALQGRTKCAKILLFAGANPTLRDHGRGLRAEQWARYCGRYVCAEVIERFARHRLLEKTTSCRWGSEPELAAQVLQGKLMPIPTTPMQPPPSGLRSRIRRVFRTSSNTEKSFSLVSQLTSAALCASSPVLPKPGDVSPVVKSLLRPLSVPQLRITLVAPQEIIEKTNDKCGHSTTFLEKIESSIIKPPRTKKKSK